MNMEKQKCYESEKEDRINRQAQDSAGRRHFKRCS